MKLDAAINTLASFIAEKTNRAVVPDEHFKQSLKKFFTDIFNLLVNPHDSEAQQEAFDGFSMQLAALAVKLGGLRFSQHDPLTPQLVAKICAHTAQIAAMRGLIKHKDGFVSDFYRVEYNLHFSNNMAPNMWDNNMSSLLRVLGLDNTIIDLHYRIANLQEITLKEEAFISEKNANHETALELASRYNKPKIVRTLFSFLLATKMISLIDDSGLFHKPDHHKLREFIATLFSCDFVAHGNVTSLEYMPAPRTSPGLIHLKNYDETPEAFKGKLDCASSEIEEVLEMLVTILTKLKDKKTRDTFLNDQEFYPTNTAFSPAILCTLSFNLARLLGHHTRDNLLYLPSYGYYHRTAFGDQLSDKALAKWQSRTLVMLEFFKHTKIQDGDSNDDAFERTKPAAPTKAPLSFFKNDTPKHPPRSEKCVIL